MSDTAKTTKAVKATKEKAPKPPRVTKAEKMIEERAVHNFENMCAAVKSVSPSFIRVSIEALEKANLTTKSKNRILVGKASVEEKMKTTPKIVLPKEWSKLDELTK
jgi:hypothetical protein